MATRYCGEITIKIRPDYNKRPTRYVCRLSTCATSIAVNAPLAGFRDGIADDSATALDHVAHAALSFADDFTAGSAVDGADYTNSGWWIRRKR
jgi:hypothetical protein